MLVPVLMMAVLVAMVVLGDNRRLRNVRVCLSVLATNRPVGCTAVAHEITVASDGKGW